MVCTPTVGPAISWREGILLSIIFHLLMVITLIVSRHSAAYGYLPASVGAFASPEEFVTILRQRGFVNVTVVQLTFGVVALYTGTRG